MLNCNICHKRKLLFYRIFNISPYVFTQIPSGRAHWMWNLILHPTSTHTAYFWQTPLPPKQEIPKKMWWWCHHHIFSSISYSLGSEVRKTYAVWVLVGCVIKFRIQWALSPEIWEKTQGDMAKIWTKRVVFFILPPKLITIILLF